MTQPIAKHPQSAVIAVYLAALAQGLTVVSFPASASLFKAQGFTDAEYGTLFLPQVGFTVLASLLGANLARRIGLGATLSAALAASTLAAGLLYASATVNHALSLPILLAGTAAMGTGFGLSAAPLNAMPAQLFPKRADTALLLLHTVMGVGFSTGPVLAGQLIRQQMWRVLPLGLCVLTVSLAVLARGALANAASAGDTNAARTVESLPLGEGAFWAFVGAAVLYAFSEGTFSNWAIIFLHEERRLPESVAGAALSVFWGATVVGRLLLSVLVVRVPGRTLWLALPVFMLGAFFAVSAVATGAQGVLAFGFAGISCSGFFPLTVALASSRFPAHAAWISSMMTAALMFGVGVASFSIGPLRGALALSGIYRLSALYPALALLIGASFTRLKPSTPGARRAAPLARVRAARSAPPREF